MYTVPHLSQPTKQTNKDRPYTCFQSQGQVQGHQNEHEHVCHAVIYRHAKFECNSLNIVRDIASQNTHVHTHTVISWLAGQREFYIVKMLLVHLGCK